MLEVVDVVGAGVAVVDVVGEVVELEVVAD